LDRGAKGVDLSVDLLIDLSDDGLARTKKKTPTSVPAALQPIPDSHPFHILWVGNFGDGLTGWREQAGFSRSGG